MNRQLLLRLSLALSVALALAACGPGGGDDGSTCDLLVGDLVVTEIFANAPGEDTGKEWFEIHNASSAAVDLAGVRVVTSREDKTGEKSHLLPSRMLESGGYFVLGGVLDDLKPDYVSYGYGNALGDLRNTSGRIALFCGQTLLDEAIYPDTSEGKSRGFNGLMAPDHTANDVLDNWCDDETNEFIMGSFGTPGARNGSCAGPQNECDDGGTLRPVVKPQAGDLVISELMANPDAVPDADGEWFEVAVLGDVDLNGLQIGNDPGTVRQTLADSTCLRVPAGTFVVFAKKLDPMVNGGIDADFTMGTTALGNSSGSLFVGIDDQALDQVTWSTSQPAGVSRSLDPGKMDPVMNDDDASWCPGVDDIGMGGDKGSPGAANPSCPLMVPMGMCNDNGTIRNIVYPVPGDLVINEVMENPAAVNDSVGEWFELLVVNPVDLNELQIGKAPGAPVRTLMETDCQRVTAGSYVVFAKSSDVMVNGGLPVVDYLMGSLSLTNSGDTLVIEANGMTLDAVTWPSRGAGGTGASWNLDPSLANPTDNDNPASWCNATTTYGAGDTGTPGGENMSCM